MALRDWSRRRIAAIWIVALGVDGLVIAVGARHPITIDYLPQATASSMRIFDSGPPMLGLADSGARGHFLRDSLRALSQVIADSLVRHFATAEAGAARKAMIFAVLVLLPLPLTALGITTRWMWLRRTNSGRSLDQAAA